MTDILGTAELDSIRATIDTVLPDTCYILRGTAAIDGQGGHTTTFATVGTAYCRLDMRGGAEATTAGAVQPYSTYVLSLTHDATIYAADRVVYGSDTFNVISVNSDQSWIGVKRAVLEKI